MNKIISSFLFIYKLQKNSMWSIIHRISGIITFMILIFISFILNVKEYFFYKLIEYNFIYFYIEYKLFLNFLLLIFFVYLIFFILIHFIYGIRNFFYNDNLSYDEIISQRFEISIYDIVFKLIFIVILIYIIFFI